MSARRDLRPLDISRTKPHREAQDRRVTPHPVSAFTTEPALAASFLREAMERIHECRSIWAAFAVTKRLRFVPSDDMGMPRLDGSIEGTEVALAAVGNPQSGYRTRAVAVAKFPLAGKVRVRPPGTWSDLLGQVRRRRFFGDRSLDDRLVVTASSSALARTVVDPRVVETVRVLAGRRLDELSYVRGAIAIEWGGVERELAVLDDVIDVLGYLAVRGSELSPYR